MVTLSESGWVGDRQPTEDDVHQANQRPQVTWLHDYKASLLASMGKTVHTPRVRRLPFQQSTAMPGACTYPLQQLYDMPNLPPREELDRLRGLFVAAFGSQFSLEAYGLPGSGSEQSQLPPHLELAYATIASMALPLGRERTNVEETGRASQLFNAGARYYVVMTETDNSENLIVSNLWPAMRRDKRSQLGREPTWLDVDSPSLRWHELDPAIASSNRCQRSGLIGYVFTVAVVHALIFGVPPLVSSRDLKTGMLGASCDIMTAYSALFSSNVDLLDSSKHPGDALILLLALISDTLFTELTSHIVQAVPDIDDPETGSTPKYPTRLIAGSAARERMEIEEWTTRALRRWRVSFTAVATQETLALSFYLELRLTYPSIDVLLWQCGYEQRLQTISGDNTAGLEVTERSARLAWLVLDHVDIVRRRFITPLRQLPGPFLASITDKWLLYYDLAGLRTLTIHELHRRYGPVVRIAPNELSFSEVSVVNQIYGQQTAFMKAPASQDGDEILKCIFSLREKAAHSHRRSLLSHAFSQQNINECIPLIMQKVNLLVELFEKDVNQQPDVSLRFRLFALDVVGELFLGSSFGGLETGTAPQFLHDMGDFFLLGGLEFHFPAIVTLVRRLPSSGLQSFLACRERVAQLGNSAFQNYIHRHGRESKRRDLLTKILSPQREKELMSDRETSMEIGNLVFAGTETTSTTLTYLFWTLARFPVWQLRMRAELNEKLGDASRGPYDHRLISNLPILEAVINEGLRLYPAAPASLPRITPESGWQYNSHTIPAKTIVSMQCYTTQRDPVAFPEPNSFMPERWLNSEPTADMKMLFMPFSKGTRACLGKGLAMLELKLVLVALLSRYEVKLPPQTTEESMEMRDHFVVVPRSGKCELQFEPVTCEGEGQ
ncbi:hypothetical protein LTR27_008228 [Elasticomyces elasticus]|nr:hypothetical protein LTR27_008228 [Elasticomyces elasticus]